MYLKEKGSVGLLMLCLHPWQQQTVNHEIAALGMNGSVCLLPLCLHQRPYQTVNDNNSAHHLWSGASICLLTFSVCVQGNTKQAIMKE